jgi:hypothetical protein
MTEPAPARPPLEQTDRNRPENATGFRWGRRLLAVAGVMVLIIAGLHTWGSVAPPPPGSSAETITEEMAAVRLPMGMGMSPSTLDVMRSLALTMTVFLAWAGLTTLAVSARGTGRDIRRRAWSGFVLMVALALVSWHYRVPPSLISFAVVAVPFLGAAVLASDRG